LQQARRLRNSVTELETQFESVELRRGFGQQQVTVADGVQSRRSAEGAAHFIASDRLADMMHYDQCGFGGFAQSQQALTQRGHRAGIILVLIMRRVQRVQDNHFGGSRAGRLEKMAEALRRAE
jgi:hypothetical protein